jgi:hypothetical protein
MSTNEFEALVQSRWMFERIEKIIMWILFRKSTRILLAYYGWTLS